MMHIFFREPWKKILKQKQPLCKILNPVVECKDIKGMCNACLEVKDFNVFTWAEQLKKEKKKKND